MTKGIYEIIYNKKIALNIYEMKLLGDTCAIKRPGQFINIQLDGFYLRRPISLCDYDERSIVIIYKVVGKGTEHMAKLQAHQTLDILVGLGNGYDSSKSGACPLLIGGGVGIPPLYNLAKELISQSKKVNVILGFNCGDEVFYENEYKSLGAKVTVATYDGSCGVKGTVLDALKSVDSFTYFYACGPEPMLKAVYTACAADGQLSFEERMGCGFGACMGCSCETKYGSKRICKDGPVLTKEEIIW